MEEIVRKSKKDKYIASQKKEIGETSVERPEKNAVSNASKTSKGY